MRLLLLLIVVVIHSICLVIAEKETDLKKLKELENETLRQIAVKEVEAMKKLFEKEQQVYVSMLKVEEEKKAKKEKEAKKEKKLKKEKEVMKKPIDVDEDQGEDDDDEEVKENR
ncbi:hypothetical protein RO3G_00717 [Rhizopus delemar RA 99-880]|uniref:Uncharacterized protein n=1 Tax=Rhizopus delemar (strain RA 99-880 / ATCC MYA-4621 / FGSC 9543 / NRRL 43880) TaxID=246409 RepID=I1BII3_RHIO9|nr:hypothetical protein RO3G_00717 [Rhizopus delemar RA 99-880]|eukprot:EIE76013.1 hypothetical protein RO3G_00717 [Rhizopus delemar RA 99-880]